MLDFRVKIGLVPERRWLADEATRRGIFEPAKAVENKNKAVRYIIDHFTDEKTEFTDLEWLNSEGLLSANADCEKVCRYLREQEVDAIFILNCNFGNEEACGIVAKEMGLPVLLWGPQDMVFEEDGTRYTDCQCGLFAISKQLRRYHVPFSYIENSSVESDTFKKGLNSFLSVVTMLKNFRGMKVTQVGTRLNPFKSVMYNELELNEKFGLNMQTVNLADAGERLGKIYDEKSEELESDLAKLKDMYDVSGCDDVLLKKMLCFVYYYIDIFDETDSDVLASECWTAMGKAFGAMPCLAMSILYDMGYIVTCESDIHGAVTQALMLCASRGGNKPMFGEFTARNPINKNSELLWHCGPFPYSMKKDGIKAKLFNTKPSFRCKDGTYTIARFQGDGGKYTLLGGKFTATEGPHTFGTHIWAQFNDLSAIEKKLINGPYIHHMSEIYGNYSEVLEEFCKFVPGLEFEPIEDR